MDKPLKLILSELNDVVALPDKTTHIVIFPRGTHTIHATDGNDEPVEATVNVDEKAFISIKQNIKNVADMFSDFNHDMKNASSWLKDIIWDAAKGIIAEVILTKDGLEAINGKSYRYFSPAFYLDDDNNIKSLDIDFGGFTNNPAFDSLKSYPIRATKNKNMEIQDKPIETVVITAEKEIEKETPKDEKKESPAEEKKETPKEEKEEEKTDAKCAESNIENTLKMLTEQYASLKSLVDGLIKAEKDKEKDDVNEDKQEEIGKEVEKEHGLGKEGTEKVVEDHLKEDPNYYTKLKDADLAEKKEVKAERKLDRNVLSDITIKAEKKPRDFNEQNLLVKKIQAEQNLPFAQAWNVAKQTNPELF
jgi:phage I-like protein